MTGTSSLTQKFLLRAHTAYIIVDRLHDVFETVVVVVIIF